MPQSDTTVRRDRRRSELENLYDTNGPDAIINLYIKTMGQHPAVGSLVLQDMIPAIVDRELPNVPNVDS